MQEEKWITYREKSYWKRKIEISNLGNVKLNGKLNKFKLSNKQKYYKLCGEYLHRIVAQLFVSNPNNYNEVDHIDGNPLNNSAANLRWCTHKENLNNPVTIKRYKISNKNKGCCIPGNPYRRTYEKGHIPWNKGKKFKKIIIHYMVNIKYMTTKITHHFIGNCAKYNKLFDIMYIANTKNKEILCDFVIYSTCRAATNTHIIN